MTGQQIVSIAITVLAIVAATLLNNSRIGDLNLSLNRRIDDTRDVLRAEMELRFAQLDNRLNTRFDSIDRKLDELLRIVGDHETRLTNIEAARR